MPHQLENKVWQAGLLPEQGASVGHARARYSGAWVDITRPTPAGESPGSFLMLPWANRLRAGQFTFNGETYQLRTEADDGSARHGDVRKRAWTVVEQSATAARYRFESADHPDFNFPFALTAERAFILDDADFIWRVTLTSRDERPFPAGFGFHPYFMRYGGGTMPLLHVPAEREWPLTDFYPDGPPTPVSERADFRKPRPVPVDATLDNLLTGRTGNDPVRFIYPDWNLTVEMHADPIFAHVLLFTAPDGTVAVEPQTNANDGFNLLQRGVDGHGVFVVEPGASVSGEIRLRVVAG